MKKIIALLLAILITFSFSIPVSAAEGDILGPDIIYKQYDKVLTMSTIKALYSSTLGEIEVDLDEYTGYGDIPAIYDVTFSAGDGAVTKDIQISVRQTLGEVIAVTYQDDHYTIHLYKNNVLSPEDIIDVLERINYITVLSTTSIFILSNNYTENASAPGVYTFEFMLATTSGYESIHDISIKVLNSEELEPAIVLTPQPSDVAVVFSLEGLIVILLAVVVIIVILKKRNKNNKKRKKGGS